MACSLSSRTDRCTMSLPPPLFFACQEPPFGRGAFEPCVHWCFPNQAMYSSSRFSGLAGRHEIFAKT